MHLRDRSTAQVMRRASTGPHAMMLRQTLRPYVPDRGTGARRSFRSYSGLGDLVQSASGGYVGASVGAAASGFFLGGATTVTGSIAGAAAMGSFVPIIGTAIGALVGLAMSGIFAHRQDPEVGNFNAAVQLFNSQGAAGILNIADKYLVLAGLFDLEPSQIKGNIPIYKKYGRMGEQRFVQDMCNLIYNAAQSGQISSNDTVQSVYSNVVLPWINGFGYGSMQDTNGNMITQIILGLIAEYVTGLWKQRWFARSGDFPNWQFQPFSLPQSALPAPTQPTASPTPSPVAAPPATVSGSSFLPPGFSLSPYVTTDGQGIYAYSDGSLYLYNAAQGSLTPYTGAAMSGGGRFAIQNGRVQQTTAASPAITQAASTTPTVTPQSIQTTSIAPTVGNPQSVFIPSPVPLPVASSGSLFPTVAPASVSPVSSGLNSTLLIGGGLGLLLLILLLKNRQGQPS